MSGCYARWETELALNLEEILKSTVASAVGLVVRSLA